jgi:hypothetical protein
MKVGKEREGIVVRLIMLYLLKYLDEESEGKIILNSILIFKDVQCLINKNNLLQFESCKPRSKSNTVIITEITTVIRNKHSDRDNEQDYVI